MKVCYDATIDINGFVYTCSNCDTLVYNQNSYEWEVMGNQLTAINEIKRNTESSGKIYDLLGRELEYVPVGKMYIRNSRLYISR